MSDLTDRIASALAAEDGERNGPGIDWLAYAAALTPLVERLQREAAADALQEAARTMPVQDHEMGYAIRNGLEPGPGKWLRDRAAELRAQP